VSDDEEGPEIIEISRQMDALAVRRARLVASFDAKHSYERYGCVNTVAWLKTRCRLSTGAAVEVVSVARRLPELPQIEAAVEQGRSASMPRP
jgi:hypothetical protein